MASCRSTGTAKHSDLCSRSHATCYRISHDTACAQKRDYYCIYGLQPHLTTSNSSATTLYARPPQLQTAQ
eukprot:5887-Heterococcus_DN1.PRE.2